MYPFISDLSYVVRFLFCWMTIEQYPIFANEALQWILSEAVWLYSILLLICYTITWYKASKLNIKSPTLRAIIYFLVYMVLATIVFLVLRWLTKLHILPIWNK